ncbi:MAG: lipid-A-disaccharide synthase [Bacteroidales bacterium]|nr:lipid-A-disaccharide synthase [Bacteroidales bacterium]
MARWYIIAGEASGDLHGSNLMRGLYAGDPGAEIRFWGGTLMASVGGTLVQDYRDGAVIGFSQVLTHPGKFAKRLSACERDILSWKPDAVILIDYPGFNFKIAEFAHKAGFKVFYYIAPKVWASRESRVKKLKAYVDKLFIVFPFEIPYFTSKGVGFIYKGNPLVDAVDGSDAMTGTREDFLRETGLTDRPIIALLPGSRSGEISSMTPVYMAFADKMRSIPEYSDYQFVIAGAPSRSMEDYSAYIGDRDYVRVVFGKSYSVMRHASAAVVNSGTASLECALVGTPQVVAYRTSAFNYLVARAIIKVRFISLGNLILDRMCFRELLQDYFTADNVLHEVRRLLEDPAYKARMLSGYSEIRESLGGGGASEAVAKAMIEELGNN